ncbi:hypothetical protein DITRI_Ditri16bG0062300 [Diplodiscus trichospermus]
MSSVSIEALAMAGVDFMEWGMDIEEWERDDELPPPHLLADDEEEEEEEEFLEGNFEQGCSCINNSSCLRSCKNPADNIIASVKVTERCYPEVVQYCTNTIEKIWFYLKSIEKILRAMIKLLMISWMERRLNNKS